MRQAEVCRWLEAPWRCAYQLSAGRPHDDGWRLSRIVADQECPAV